MEDRRSDHEHHEKHNLDAQPAHDDALPELHVRTALRFREEAAACRLRKEGEHVASDKDLCEPCGAHGRVRLAAGEANEAAEYHVNGGREEGGCEKDEEGLHDVGGCGPVWGLLGREEAAEVADCFEEATDEEGDDWRC